jgi:methylmalonyl-CoA mutase
MANNLFSEFDPTNKSAWEKQVEKEIKKPVNELNRHALNLNKKLDPYYSFEEFDPENIAELSACQRTTPGWLNMPETIVNDVTEANKKIQESLSGGAQAVVVDFQNKITTDGVSRLFHNIRLTDTPVFLKTRQNPLHVFELISKGSGYIMKGGIANDPLAQWMRSGQSFNHSLKDISSLCKATESMKDFYPVMVDGHVFHNAGATPQQELAFILANLAFYLDKLTDADIAPGLAFKSVFFSVSVGTDYLPEIAKLRALRLLHQRMANAYKVNNTKVFIHASTSSLYNSATLPHTNMLRATSSAMSAVIGGCDALTVRPYDELISQPNDFSERIARNVSSIIAHESYINQVADPAAGSYYIEKLSQELAESAWELFLEIENNGGIIDCFENGYIQDGIEKSWQEKLAAMNNGRVMVGVNKYLNEFSEISDFTSATDNSETEVRLLQNRNLAESWRTLHH